VTPMAQAKKLTGLQKTAILMIALGPDISSNILKRFPEHVIEKITYEIANTVRVSAQQKNEVLKEFETMSLAHDYILEGGLEYAKNLLTKALGAQKSKEIIDSLSQITQQNQPFATARKADVQHLFNTISKEHPQTIALILCYLQPDKAATILSGLPQEMQMDVAYRIATMNGTSPMIIKQVEKVLDKKLSSVIGNDYTSIGGVGTLVEILNAADRGTEKNILEEMEHEQPELAEQIREGLFVFEDIVHLDSLSLQRVIREVDKSDLALALKGSSEEVASAVFKNLSKRAADALREDIDFIGPVKLVQVEEAQKKIVSIIRALDDAGEIIIARGGDDIIVV